jgi:tetratricopeptide (TPR) repeat protein
VDAVEAVPGDPDADELVGRLVSQLERAAVRMSSLGAPREAAGHLRTALRYVSDDHTRADLRSRLAWALAEAGLWGEVLEPARAAVNSFDEWGDEVAAAEAAVAQGQALMSAGDNEAALSLLTPRWEALQRRPDAVDVQLKLNSAIGRARMRLGIDPREALQERLRLADLVGDHEATADAFISLATYYLAIGAHSLVLVLIQAAVDLARRHHLVPALARALTNLTAYTVSEDLSRAEVLGREAVAAATRAGGQMMRDYASLNLAIARFARGDWDGLREELGDPDLASDVSNLPIRTAFQISLDIARDEPSTVPWEVGSRDLVDYPGAWAWQAHCEALLARREGAREEATRLAVTAVEGLGAIIGLGEDLPMLWPSVAEVVEDGGDEEAFIDVLAVTDNAGQRVPRALLAHRRWIEGRHAARAGAAEAEGLLREAVAGYDQWGSPVYAARARADLAGVLADAGRDREAADLAQRAREVFGRLGASAWLARVRP